MNKVQIEIDLDDILYDVREYGERVPIETTTDCVKRQLKSKIVEEIKSQYLAEFKKILFNELLSDIKCQCLHEAKTKIPELLEQALTAKYETKDRWGGKGQETSFMEEFVKELQNQMVYKKCSYDSDKNTYTKLVDNTVNELTKQWKADFDKYIKEEVIKEAYDYAIQKIAKAFNVREKDLKDV